MKVYDMMRDDNGDILIENGDLVIGESTRQNINDILIANKGDFRFNPLVGADITRLLHEEADTNEVKADIQENVEKDQAKIKELTITDKLRIVAEYKK